MSDRATGELIERWVGGDAAAGEALVARYWERAREFSRRVSGKVLDPDELAAEALSAGLEGLRAGKRPDRFTGWLHGVVRNLARHRYRDRRRKEVLEDPPPAPGSGPATMVAGQEIGRLFDEVIARLPEASREVIDLFRQGLSREEIAARLNLPMMAVHGRFLRAFKFLRGGLSRHFTTLVMAEGASVRWEEIRRLRPIFREAIVARHFEGWTRLEAARRLRIPEESLDARLQVAYDTLHCHERSDFAAAAEAWRCERGG